MNNTKAHHLHFGFITNEKKVQVNPISMPFSHIPISNSTGIYCFISFRLITQDINLPNEESLIECLQKLIKEIDKSSFVCRWLRDQHLS